VFQYSYYHLYTKFDVYTLFHLEVSDDAEHQGAQTTPTPTGQRLGLLDCIGQSSVGLYGLLQDHAHAAFLNFISA
jgi:hypothetical protein